MKSGSDRIRTAGRRLRRRGEPVSAATVAREAGLSRATVYRIAGSRQGLLDLLDLGQEPSTRDRVLKVAMDMVGERGLTALAMDDLAVRAAVSRANLYRIFPGKPALFRELMRAFSPMEAIAATLQAYAGRPPAEVVPALYRTAGRTFQGRAGILRSLFYEVTSLEEDTREAAQFALGSGLGQVLAYLLTQMQAGRLRRVHPVIALQAFAGPLLMYLMTRELATRLLGLEVTTDEALTALADHYLRAMRPEEVSE